jgi:hypothetical protein
VAFMIISNILSGKPVTQDLPLTGKGWGAPVRIIRGSKQQAGGVLQSVSSR